MKIGLCMIVKNESHIVHESLGCTLPLIDTYCIVDTGSTDNTIEKIKTFYSEKGIDGEVHERPWKNFGHNRSEALKLCDNKMDYILMIDADDLMGFPPNGRQILQDILAKEKPNGANIIIRHGTELEYWRCQIFKANDDWKYVGVLHEYPSNSKPNSRQVQLPKTFWMESRRLGGRNLTGDKLKKDIEVLLKGIDDEPNNERYIFYLAQSYRDSGDFKNALKYYKKRFQMRRWEEEAWHSAMRVGEAYLALKNPLKFEYWMQRAFEFRPCRAEPLYKLTEYFRVHGPFHKAYSYLEAGRKVPPTTDSLFVEQFPYNGGFDYEASILDYYIHTDKRIGLRDSIKYLLRNNANIQTVISNLKFYVSAISSQLKKLTIPKVFGDDFYPSAVSVIDYPFANSRFVNYKIYPDGSYKHPNGGPVITRNAYLNLETGECVSPMADPAFPFQSDIQGIEDLRAYKRGDAVYFTATSYQQFIEGQICIVHGRYNTETYTLEDCVGIQSPTKQSCEKNWVNIEGTNQFIYGWSPLRVGQIIQNRFIYSIENTTPPLFQLFRGSSPVIDWNSKKIALVHFVDHNGSRKYYHCFVELSDTYVPTRVSLPFFFRENKIEYCVSIRKFEDTIVCYTSLEDADPHEVHIRFSDIEWMAI
uniref:Glycosyltransferase 2-like domain-containing protein n=1 Tax=viral metagenome TaxID=1070528 RepID=A0A6C0JYI4_9ZZZZ